MSIAYDNYLDSHRRCVSLGINWIFSRFTEDEIQNLFPKIRFSEVLINVRAHDASKYSDDEYNAYDDYFYAEKKTDEIKKNFDYAWLHHLHNNPHHWQYWVLKEDDGSKFEFKALDIPDIYIVEMLADWWSFSWKEYLLKHDRNDLYEIFNWYNGHKDAMIMSDKTVEKVEKFLDLLRDKLDNSEAIIEIVSL